MGVVGVGGVKGGGWSVNGCVAGGEDGGYCIRLLLENSGGQMVIKEAGCAAEILRRGSSRGTLARIPERIESPTSSSPRLLFFPEHYSRRWQHIPAGAEVCYCSALLYC